MEEQAGCGVGCQAGVATGRQAGRCAGVRPSSGAGRQRGRGGGRGGTHRAHVCLCSKVGSNAHGHDHGEPRQLLLLRRLLLQLFLEGQVLVDGGGGRLLTRLCSRSRKREKA